MKLPYKFRYSPGDRVVYVPVKSPSYDFAHSNESPYQEQRTGQLGRHFLINFFMINYIWNVFNRAPWYIRLYSLPVLVVDLLLNTGYRYFVRLFAKHVLNQDGLFGQYRDMINFSKASICAGALVSLNIKLQFKFHYETKLDCLPCTCGRVVVCIFYEFFGWNTTGCGASQ